jgi:hypothetical protein
VAGPSYRLFSISVLSRLGEVKALELDVDPSGLQVFVIAVK